jgi:hypothetical protein
MQHQNWLLQRCCGEKFKLQVRGERPVFGELRAGSVPPRQNEYKQVAGLNAGKAAIYDCVSIRRVVSRPDVLVGPQLNRQLARSFENLSSQRNGLGAGAKFIAKG